MTRNGKYTGGGHLLEGMPQTLVHGAEEGATKVAEAVESAGARVARRATHVARSAGQAGGLAAGISPQLRGRRARMRSWIPKPSGRVTSAGDAMLKAQLAKTSRELANESSDLSAAVDSLNKIIKSNRRAAARGRTRLLSGLVLGAALMYHLDAEHGPERRAATARMITDMVRGPSGPQAPSL
ncbi:MAG TPA: hypothetical protein VFN36_01320 [Solirubrobacteraceae bacterium]|nr:hypothetical protein [Solirubrobacteraceae bacterium]